MLATKELEHIAKLAGSDAQILAAKAYKKMLRRHKEEEEMKSLAEAVQKEKRKKGRKTKGKKTFMKKSKNASLDPIAEKEVAETQDEEDESSEQNEAADSDDASEEGDEQEASNDNQMSLEEYDSKMALVEVQMEAIRQEEAACQRKIGYVMKLQNETERDKQLALAQKSLEEVQKRLHKLVWDLKRLETDKANRTKEFERESLKNEEEQKRRTELEDEEAEQILQEMLQNPVKSEVPALKENNPKENNHAGDSAAIESSDDSMASETEDEHIEGVDHDMRHQLAQQAKEKKKQEKIKRHYQRKCQAAAKKRCRPLLIRSENPHGYLLAVSIFFQ